MIYMPSTIPSKILLSSLIVVIAFMTSAEVTHAKRARPSGLAYLKTRDVKMRRGGCASFGHSCFGGHGKRSMPANNGGDPEEITGGIQHDGAPAFEGGIRPDLEIFSRDEGQLDANGLNSFLRQQYHEPDDYTQLTPFLRKWLGKIYRRPDLSTDKK